MPSLPDENRWRRLVEECFLREAGANAPIPDSDKDLIETGALDSMGWVSFLRALESASGFHELGALLVERPPSLNSIFVAFRDFHAGQSPPKLGSPLIVQRAGRESVVLECSAVALGSRRIASAEIDRAYGMEEGKLSLRAGIESVAYSVDAENELTLAARAAQQALHSAACGAQQLDWIIATSETHHEYPSLAAQLHSQLLARETCGALDVGGACLGLLNGLAVAQSLIGSGHAKYALVVTADVHSRILTPARVAGEFGGLFGDGASAFLLRAGTDKSAEGPSVGDYALGEFFFGCAGQYAGAICVAPNPIGGLDTHFDGEALSRAAITKLEKVILETELRSGIKRSQLFGLATHQPNPRLLTLLAKQLGLSNDKFPTVAQSYGNLGSSTCGVALHTLLQSPPSSSEADCGPIFLASLGPGLLFGGGWMVPS